MSFLLGSCFSDVVIYSWKFIFFFFSSRRRHTRCREVSWARRCVQETGNGRTNGVPVVAPAAWLGSQVRNGQPLKASKREANLKIRYPLSMETCLTKDSSKTTRLIGQVCKHSNVLSLSLIHI
eukprot:TRINITY_DN10775_c0_g1_i2.p3 TRINITY_DN10775_c0_g1~~TRINITY_DN10775_c0_g1_i2.p3  ORF type:complete len:123 (+),score=16.14 TRINITY_DN10775_c0_g1_i2:64-432(+)